MRDTKYWFKKDKMSFKRFEELRINSFIQNINKKKKGPKPCK